MGTRTCNPNRLTLGLIFIASVSSLTLLGQQKFTRNPHFDNTYQPTVEATINKADPEMLRYHQNTLTGATNYALVGASDIPTNSTTLESGGVFGIVRGASSATAAVAGSFFVSPGANGGPQISTTLAAPLGLTDATLTLVDASQLIQAATYLDVDSGTGSNENIAVCGHTGSIVNICPGGRGRYWTSPHTHSSGASAVSGQKMYLWGLNVLMSDGDPVAGVNYDYVHMQNEWDFNVFNTHTYLVAHSIGGASPVQPETALGYLVNSLGPGAKWDFGFGCLGGAVKEVCVQIDSKLFFANSDSQTIQFISLDDPFALRTNKLFASSTGNFFLKTDGLFAITSNVPGADLFATIGPNGIQIPRVISAVVHRMNLNVDSFGNSVINQTDTLRIANDNDTTTFITLGPSGISLPKVVSSVVHRNILVDDASANLQVKLAGGMYLMNEAGSTTYAIIDSTGYQSIRPTDPTDNPFVWASTTGTNQWRVGPFQSIDDPTKSEFVIAFNTSRFWRFNQGGDLLPYLDGFWSIGSIASALKNVYTWTLTAPAASTFSAISVAGNLLPSVDNASILGHNSKRWQRAFLSGGITTDGASFINNGSSIEFDAGAFIVAPNGSTGLSSTINVRKADNSAGCTITVSGGIVTGTTC